MPTAARGNDAEFGIALQSAEGSAAANPQYAHPLVSGLVKPVRVENEIEVSGTSDQVTGIWTSLQHGEANPSFHVLPQSLGYHLLAMLPVDGVTGVSDYVHTFTKGTAAQPWVTLFSRAPGTPSYRKLSDATCQQLVFTFAAGQILMVQANYLGFTPTQLASAYTAVATEAITTTGSSYLTYVGATVDLDLAATPATTDAHNILSGTITLEREVELEQTDSVEPEYRDVGRFRIGVTLDTKWASEDAFRNTFYGSTTGTASSLDNPTGSFRVLFPSAPTSDADVSLDISLPAIRWRVPEPQDVDVSGGAVTLALTGTGVNAAVPVSIVLKNQVATYVAA